MPFFNILLSPGVDTIFPRHAISQKTIELYIYSEAHPGARSFLQSSSSHPFPCSHPRKAESQQRQYDPSPDPPGMDPADKADKVGIGCARISGIINNANFCIIDNLIAQGREMPYIAGHLNMNLVMAWAIKLTGPAGYRIFDIILKTTTDQVVVPSTIAEVCTNKSTFLLFFPSL